MAYKDKYGVEYSDDKKTLVRCPKDFEGEYIIPEGTTVIDREAFADCIGLTSITIPNSVKIIGKYAFDECTGLTTINYDKYLDRLTKLIRFEANFAAEKEYEDFSTRYSYRSLWLKDFNPKDVDEAIERVRVEPREKKLIGKGFLPTKIKELQVIKLGIDDIRNMTKEVRRPTDANQVGINGFGKNVKYFDFSTLPLILENNDGSVFRVSNSEEESAITEKLGTGILLVRGINKENVNELPHNFTYGLIKCHSLMGCDVSRHWLIIIESTTVIDTGGICGPVTPTTFLK